LTIDSTPFPDRPGATEQTRKIGEQVGREVEARYAAEQDEEPAPDFVIHESRITIHEQLVARYVGALIDWVARTAYVRDDGPPGHVYDRIERLLQIEGGAA
jgi:hypothetical protein